MHETLSLLCHFHGPVPQGLFDGVELFGEEVIGTCQDHALGVVQVGDELLELSCNGLHRSLRPTFRDVVHARRVPTLGRHLRDACGAGLMVNNDRILGQNATMQIGLREG